MSDSGTSLRGELERIAELAASIGLWSVARGHVTSDLVVVEFALQIASLVLSVGVVTIIAALLKQGPRFVVKWDSDGVPLEPRAVVRLDATNAAWTCNVKVVYFARPFTSRLLPKRIRGTGGSLTVGLRPADCLERIFVDRTIRGTVAQPITGAQAFRVPIPSDVKSGDEISVFAIELAPKMWVGSVDTLDVHVSVGIDGDVGWLRRSVVGASSTVATFRFNVAP